MVLKYKSILKVNLLPKAGTIGKTMKAKISSLKFCDLKDKITVTSEINNTYNFRKE